MRSRSRPQPAALLVSAIVALLVLPGAARASAVAGELSAAHVVLDGPVSFDAPMGGLDVAPALRTGGHVRIEWQKATGYEVRSTWDRIGASGYSLQGPPENRTVDWGPGSLDRLACRGVLCQVVVVAREGATARLAARGQVAGATLGENFRSETFAAGFSAEGPDSFRFVTDAGWLRVGAGPRSLPLAEASAEAEGDLVVLLDDVGGTLREGAGSRDIDTGNTTGPSPIVPGGERVTHAWMVLVLDGARVAASGPSLLVAPAASARASSVVLTDAHGWLQGPDGRVDVADDSIAMSGDLMLALQGAHAMVLGGDADLATVSGSAVLLGGRTGVDAAPVAGALVLSALAALACRLAWALYSRVSRERLLENPNRQRVLERVASAPGSPIAAIARDVRLSQAVTAYHLRRLERAGIVWTARHGRTRVAFVRAIASDASAEARVLLRDATRRRVAEVLLERAAPTQADLAREAGVSQRLVSYHLRLLAEASLVTSEGRPARYEPTQALRDAAQEA